MKLIYSTYTELLLKYSNRSGIPYFELLLTKEWEGKRNQILNRDNQTCCYCGKKSTEYIEGLGNIWIYIQERIERGYSSDGDGVEEFEYVNEVTYHEVSDKPYYLHVHHKYYILSCLPWEYSDDALMSLCSWCHWKFHAENTVPVFENQQKIINLNYHPCHRCNGAGWFPQYNHVQSGICFRCSGEKYEELIKET